MNKHLMMDFETLGHIAPDVVVLSLGVVLFDREKVLGETEWVFEIQSQIDRGRTVSASTLAWWLSEKVSPEARQVIAEAETKGIPSETVMGYLNAWLHELLGEKREDIRAWGNGAGFDAPIAESLFRQAELNPPWKFWNIRCYRTLKAMFHIEKEFQRVTTKHSALEDAKYQAACLQKFLAKNPSVDF